MNEERFCINLARVCIEIMPRDKHIMEFFRCYLYDAGPAFTVKVTDADIEAERERTTSFFEDPDVPEIEIEKLYIFREIAEKITKFKAFPMHATAVRIDGEAYLFAGPSGAGKTTHAKLWKKEFGERMWMINDDKPLIRIHADGIVVYSSPWSGKEGWSNTINAPLKAIIFLQQSDENRIEKMDRTKAWESLMSQVYRSQDSQNMQKTLGFIETIIDRVPVYSMECTRDPEAVRVAYEAVK